MVHRYGPYKMDGPPAEKKPKLDSYIPTQEDGGTNVSIIFSLKEEKGALARALKPFEVLSREIPGVATY